VNDSAESRPADQALAPDFHHPPPRARRSCYLRASRLRSEGNPANDSAESCPADHAPITAEILDRVAWIVIERQDTHLDGLSARLRDLRVGSVIEPMLTGQTLWNLPRDALCFVLGLGLARWADKGGLEVANPIYREVIVREFTRDRADAGLRARACSLGCRP
jgi:hypothetical protein